MRDHQWGQTVRQTLAAVAIATLTVGSFANLAFSVALKDGDRISGFVRGNSSSYQFRNPARPTVTQAGKGEEHTFTAQRGDSIEVVVEAEDGSALRPTLILFDPAGRQVAYSENPNFFKYQVVRAGNYRLLVIGRNASLGRYSLAIDGLSQAAAAVPQADQVMQNVLKLRSLGCGVPNVAKIKIGNEERCTRDIEPGSYTYDDTSRSLKLVDTRRDVLVQRLQLNILDRCPSPATSVAQITTTDPQDGRDYTYCATPNRYVAAGAYRYNPSTDTLTAATATPTPPPTTPTPPPTNQPPDPRRQLLQNEYGLNVLDACPASRTSVAIVNFPEGSQVYQYCATPNRLFTAGEYTYNKTTGNLDRAAKPTNCTVTIGGICIVK
jgi:hypothetical protein